MGKFHYYSFAFIGGGNISSTHTSIYVGYETEGITKPQIEQAKKDSGIDEKAVLLSCCYLGHMTNDTMIGGHNQPD